VSSPPLVLFACGNCSLFLSSLFASRRVLGRGCRSRLMGARSQWRRTGVTRLPFHVRLRI